MDTIPTPPRGIRLRNPTNLRLSSATWLGKVQSPDKDFEAFDTMVNGIRAAAKNILGHYRRGAKSVRAIISILAPASETEGAGNPTESYVSFVARALGCSADVMIDIVDLRVMERLLAAICDFETGHYPIAPEDIRVGCARALGLAP